MTANGPSSSSIARRGGDRTAEGSSCRRRARSRTPPPASRSLRSHPTRSLTWPSFRRSTGSPTHCSRAPTHPHAIRTSWSRTVAPRARVLTSVGLEDGIRGWKTRRNTSNGNGGKAPGRVGEGSAETPPWRGTKRGTTRWQAQLRWSRRESSWTRVAERLTSLRDGVPLPVAQAADQSSVSSPRASPGWS